jgi:hypothetical protein
VKAYGLFDVNYRTKQNYTITLDPSAEGAGYALASARAGVLLLDDKLDLQVWSDNLFNKAYYINLLGLTRRRPAWSRAIRAIHVPSVARCATTSDPARPGPLAGSGRSTRSACPQRGGRLNSHSRRCISMLMIACRPSAVSARFWRVVRPEGRLNLSITHSMPSVSPEDVRSGAPA